jgi:hypothetical protein
MLAFVAAAAAWGPALGRAIGGETVEPVARGRYVVQQGDTLWSIAKQMTPAEDPRPLVDAISSENSIDAGALVPGQTLLIPSG